jgi:heme o synthase
MTQSATYHESNDARVSDYLVLLKPRVMSLVVFTGLIGLYMAPGYIHPVMVVVVIVSIAIGSGGAGALNMWYDQDIDAIMTRTQKRPIPMGKIAAIEVLHLGLILSIFSIFIMGLFINLLSAFLLAFAITFYSVIYTIWLKRSSVQNIVIGGISGALPPVIGWASVTNSITIESITLFFIIFLWTPPHFWALALKTSQDYKLANIPMLPGVAGRMVTLKHILIYTIVLSATSLLPFFLGMAGIYYLMLALFLGVCFIYYTVRMFANSDYYIKTFKYSILYLFLLFLSLALNKL